LSIWNDHSDVMSIRDCGWIQVFVENGQETFDHVLWAFRVGEDHKVLHPVIVNMDGFLLTHTIEPVELLDQETVNRFLPPYEPVFRLHPDKPLTMGCFAMPGLFTEAKKAQDEALKTTMPMILKGWKEFGDLTGRYYRPIEEYETEDAEVLLITMGSFGETASAAVDMMRAKGKAVGVIKIRLWRPFPFEAFRKAAKKAKTLIVIDRATSYGGPGGPVASELRAALYGEKQQPAVVNFIAGLAGRDVGTRDFEEMVDQTLKRKKRARQEDYQIYGVRE
ncbi:MAG: pyruvate ferredoxin oxidoreductase, partial [Proteobacteria bacterium]|nr:pyruvate ferredoxin oxidoreductase [Pseudomonadota bacterium]NIS70875.1 pyruvate ferredoxin oxidoreductase [Pseudomonadota bacterium]